MNLGVAKVSRKKSTAAIRKHRTGKQSHRRRDKTSKKRQMCKVKSVVVSSCKEEREGKDRLRRPHRSSEHQRSRHRQEGHRSYCSARSLSPGSDSKMFWERGHHSNPRSFIDCCYPDNSSGNSPARKAVGVEEWGRSWGQCTDQHSRRWTEEKFEDWHHPLRASVSPGTWGRRGGSTEEGDWDRWTCGSTDSWEDMAHLGLIQERRHTLLSNRPSSARHVSSPEWWSRQAHSPPCVSRVSPCSCSPCSTTLSELSWEWSTCSGISVDKLTVSSSSCPSSSPHRPPLTVHNVSTPQCELSETHSHVATSPDTDCNSSNIHPGLCTTQSLSQKTAKTLHLPLIGKRPAIQRKARLKRCLIDQE
ncbi:hypothetical protein WMY93_026005 [Mugilogobius chulae]|uniref:Uncharacterized protein n=1 Tax=Mugilogobius chulae TaxID=88201 RepID=A0AAW0MZQ0_9GOBI